MKKTVLIIDDEKHTRDGLRSALEDEFEVYVAGDTSGAIAVLDADPIDLVITDLKIGTEDGMDLLEKLMSLPNAPICIMMTAYGSVDTAVEAMRRGAYDFVTKPVNMECWYDEPSAREPLKKRTQSCVEKSEKSELRTK
jgi:two-component system, NtrC family, response regulator AtoC